MRTLVIGDIHGGYKALLQVLKKAAVSSKDTLIFLGDYVDGWSQSVEVIDTLLALEKTNHCIFLRGNHDQLFLDYLQHGTKTQQWLMHGGAQTLKDYQKCSASKIKEHQDFLERLNDFYIDTKNRLFVHAGFTNLHGVDKEHFKKMLYWDRTLWETALALDPNLPTTAITYPKRFLQYHEIYIGHTTTAKIGHSLPQNRANIWNLDTGAAYTNPLTILDIDTKTFWQSDNANLLYPTEKGRNQEPLKKAIS